VCVCVCVCVYAHTYIHTPAGGRWREPCSGNTATEKKTSSESASVASSAAVALGTGSTRPLEEACMCVGGAVALRTWRAFLLMCGALLLGRVLT